MPRIRMLRCVCSLQETGEISFKYIVFWEVLFFLHNILRMKQKSDGMRFLLEKIVLEAMETGIAYHGNHVCNSTNWRFSQFFRISEN